MRGWPSIILTVRYHRGWSIEQLADQLEVTPGYIKMLERGDRLPSFNLLDRIEKVTNIPVSFLMILANYEKLNQDHAELLKHLLEDSDLLNSLFTLLLYCEYATGHKQSVTAFRNYNLVVKEKIYG